MIVKRSPALARGLLLLWSMVLAMAVPAAAQKPTFELEGVVTDAQQGVLPGATVTLQNVATGLSRETATDANGRYVFTALPPAGEYTLQTALSGFATERRENLTFNAGQRAVVNVTLKLSSVQETVTVAGDSPVVLTTTSEVTKTIESRDLVTLPVPERNYFRLLTLDSNVVARAPGTNGLYVGGGDVWNFGTYVDGTSNFSKWLTLQRAPQRGSAGFALETVSQVQIITNQFSAEFGGHSAGVMNMITKSGSNIYAGAALLVVRPGDLDAIPPLATQKVPFNQQQFGGNVGGPVVRDKIFFFGSYERRRERSQVSVTSPEAPGLVVPTPADEDQGHVRGDFRFSPSQSLAVRYNMVRWTQDNESGGLQLPGTGYIWTNNVDTIHNMWTSIVSDRVLNEVRDQWSRYYDLRKAKCECVQFNRTGYSITGGVATGTWGVIPEDTWDVSDTLSLWRGAHSLKMGGGVTYDVTTQRYLPNQNGIYNFAGGPAVAPNPNLFTQAFALIPGQDIIYPKAWVLTGFAQDEWRASHNFTLNYGVRYDVELVKDIPDWPAPTDKNNVDPRVGFNWVPRGDQRWSVHGGVGRFTQQNPIFTIVKGAVLGRNGIVTLALPPSDPAFPVYPNPLPGFPPGSVLPARNIQEISPDLENEFAWQESLGVQRQIGSRTSAAIDLNVNRSHKHGFLDTNYPTPIPKDVINAGGGRIIRTTAQADATRPITPAPNGFRRIEVLTNEGRTWYEGVRFNVQHRTAPLLVSVSYTLSDAEDRLNHWEIPEDSSNPELDHADSASNTPHNFVASATWDIPGRGAVLEGWRVSSVVHAQSGNPYTIRYAQDLTGTTQVFCTAQRTCNVTTPEGRNTARSAPVRYADLTLTRTFTLARKDRLEVRADVFNLFNNENFTADGYIGILGNVNFGKPTSGAYPGRQFQFGAIYRF
ncbi:MAG TPA: carboxypeptidase regulatory-like domain-containing protein [Vicinamibacterales bacterium]|nr:carboxypeptidase regulatory-like domain-containing protein [Vicinamibacterales bacterium]